MAQKSILSFFKSCDKPITKESDKTTLKDSEADLAESPKSKTRKQKIVEDSPVKKTKSKRKVKCIESDDESTDISDKVMNGDSKTNGSVDEHKESSSQSSKSISNGESSNKKLNRRSISKKPAKLKKIESNKEKKQSKPTERKKIESDGGKTPNKQKKIESDEEKEQNEPTNLKKIENEEEKPSTESPTKMETDQSDVKNEQNNEKNKSNDTSDGASTITENSSLGFIPKRKTARKTMSSAKNVKNKPVKVEAVKDETVNVSDESIKVSDELGKASDRVAKNSDELNKASDQSKKDKATGVNGEPAKVESQSDLNIEAKEDMNSVTQKSIVSNDKKLNSDVKNKDAISGNEANAEKDLESKVSVDSKKSSKRKSSKKGMSLKLDKNLNSDIENKDAISSNEANTEKELKDKASSESKKTSKRKANISKKDTPLKKSANKESIHSFFTPLKKADDKVKIENDSNKDSDRKDSESQQVANDDSPVKKVRKQRNKVLESDDEDEEPAPINMETGETGETVCNSSSVENKVTASVEKKSESVALETKTSPKKSEGLNSKNDEEKKMFGVKSTSTSRTVYDPSKIRYHPIEDACWKRNEKVPYLALAKTLELIENISGRLKIIEILSNFFRSVIVLTPEDLLHSVYLCLNRLAPEYEGIELGVGETLLMKAVAQATGRTLEKIKEEVKIKGDLGLVSESSRGNQRVMFAPPKLTVSSVFSKFLEIAKMSGNSAMAKKTDKIQSMFVACRDCEAKYIIRSLSGKLRIGLAEQSVLSALSRAAVLTPPGQDYPPKIIDASKGMSQESFKERLDPQTLILKTAYCECPNYDLLIPVLLEKGIAALPECCQLLPGRPLKPMLAHPTAGIDKVLERFDKNAFTCEFKYDGERAQIHMTEDGKVTIFSRNQEDNTTKYPDVISRISNAVKDTTKSFILDSEAVAWDKETKQILPFQVLSTRKRKDAVESEIVVQVCIMAFDLLYLNGESLVKKPLKERRSLLHSSFSEVGSEFMFAQYKDGNSAETMQEFLDESVKGNCEGLMVKALEVDASYEIAKRSHNWLKLKKDYLQGIGDTLDLVVIGGYYGKGKRTGNYGGFLLACYDEENEEYQSICKLGTGFKDEDLETHTSLFKQHTIDEPKSYFRYDQGVAPDVWFEPVQVWEIKCADLSISPVHKAAIGIVDPEKGISLRFPRFIRIRDDKTPENATNSVQIADMYQKQEQIQNTTNKNAKTEEDYY